MFADLAALRDALAPLVGQGLVREVRLLATAARAGEALQPAPLLSVVPLASACAGPGGLGNGRTLTETVGVIVQVRRLDGDANAATDLQAIRSAVYAILEGQRIPADWSPLRYQGGQMLAIADGLYSWIERYATEIAVPTRPRSAP